MTVGVLALQGDFREHAQVLRTLGAEVSLVRRPEELARVDGLVIPGGESSVMDKLARAFGLADPLRAAVRAGLPVYGTCAGLIMLADTVVDGIRGQESIGGLDISVRRNAFGSQTQSFETDLDVPVLGEAPVHAVFIRAPWVESVGPEVEVLARIDDLSAPAPAAGRIVAVRQGSLMATSFHPEVEGDGRIHRLFLDLID